VRGDLSEPVQLCVDDIQIFSEEGLLSILTWLGHLSLFQTISSHLMLHFMVIYSVICGLYCTNLVRSGYTVRLILSEISPLLNII
jgi:hypothetical protein